jgi:beta-phosphoglucomutase-like phosphatase (HAD superfamily)
VSAPILAVVFDFDGVLAHTEPLHLASFREAFERESRRPLSGRA